MPMMLTSVPGRLSIVYRMTVGALVLVLALALSGFYGALAQSKPPSRLDQILASIVRVDATIPATARTAGALGMKRIGSGVVIDTNGLILTIGYVILEADAVSVRTLDGRSSPAKIIAYDYDTGFGLVRAADKLGVAPLPLGDSRTLTVRKTAIVIAYGGRQSIRPVRVVSRRDFAGYWEYVLEKAIFTGPLYRNHSGAALLDVDGKLVGIGSLAVGNAAGPGRVVPGNMFVPIEKLKPVMGDLLDFGRTQGKKKPWIGAFTRVLPGNRIAVIQVSPGGPADRAGLRRGDIVLDVAGRKVANQLDFYRTLWAQGGPGTKIGLTIERAGATQTVEITAGDRYQWLRLGKSK